MGALPGPLQRPDTCFTPSLSPEHSLSARYGIRPVSSSAVLRPQPAGQEGSFRMSQRLQERGGQALEAGTLTTLTNQESGGVSPLILLTFCLSQLLTDGPHSRSWPTRRSAPFAISGRTNASVPVPCLHLRELFLPEALSWESLASLSLYQGTGNTGEMAGYSTAWPGRAFQRSG